MGYHEYISDATMQYLLHRYPEHTPAWLKAFEGEVHRLEDLWALSIQGHERSSRFGTILYGRSEMHGEVAVKIVPWFSPRLAGEVYCYHHLPYRQMCPLYDVDERLGAMLLKYVPAAQSENSRLKEQTIADLYGQRLEARPADAALPLYRDVLAEVTQIAREEIARSGCAGYRELEDSIQRATGAIHAFDGAPLYLIHGDAHAFNLLEEQEGCLLIDPLGYRAPFDFEWARYLGTAMKEQPMTGEEFRDLTLRLTGDHAPLEQSLRAFAIDTTLRACNTFIEGNTHEEICSAADWARRAWRFYDVLKHA